MDSRAKGNVAEKSLDAELERIKPEVRAVSRIPCQDDANHWDLLVTLDRPFACFQVQAKAFSTANPANLSLRSKHLRDWLDASIPTVPMWWDENRRKVYWADFLRFVFRKVGIARTATMKFDACFDLHELNIADVASKRRFISWIRDRCIAWPLLGLNTMGGWPSNLEFPASLADAICDPDVLLYLPVSMKLVNAIDDYLGPAGPGRGKIAVEVRRSAPTAVRSAAKASRNLAHVLRIPLQDTDIIRSIADNLASWVTRLEVERRDATARNLWAFDKLISLQGYESPGDIAMPPFTSAHTYPVGRLVNLVPPEILVNPIQRILLTECEADVLLHSAYWLGILNFHHGDDLWSLVRYLRFEVRKRKRRIGEMWRAVDRQLLYTEAQLGGEQARSEFLTALSKDGGAVFDASYNFAYYGGDLDIIRDRFERRLDETVRTDRNVLSILQAIYKHLRKAVRRQDDRLLHIDAKAWPAE